MINYALADLNIGDSGWALRAIKNAASALATPRKVQRGAATVTAIPVATVSQALLHLIAQHQQAVVFLDENPDDEQASDYEDRFALEIAAFRAETKADRSAKAKYLLTRSDRWMFCPHEDMYETLLRSMIAEVA